MVRTLFPDQTIVTVVGVVCITKSSVTVFEFEEFVAVFSRMSSTGGGEVRCSQAPNNSRMPSLVSLYGGQKNRE